jgi:hypothetical protein
MATGCGGQKEKTGRLRPGRKQASKACQIIFGNHNPAHAGFSFYPLGRVLLGRRSDGLRDCGREFRQSGINIRQRIANKF